MGFVLFGASSVLGLVKRNSRILFLVILGVAFVLFSFCSTNSDYAAYELYYSGILVVDFEPGFSFVCSLCSRLGLTFLQFRIIYSLVVFSIIYLSVSKLTPSISFVGACYLIVPFWIDAVQMRLMMAGALVFCASAVYIRKGKKGLLPYLALVLLAAAFHKMSLFFLIGAVIPRCSRKRLYAIAIGASLGLFAIHQFDLLPVVGSYLMDEVKVATYLHNSAGFGAVAACACTLFPLSLLSLTRRGKLIEEKRGEGDVGSSLVNFAEGLLILLIPICVLYFVDTSNMFRFLRMTLLVVYCAFSLQLSKSNSLLNKRERTVGNTLFVLWIMCLFFVTASMHTFDSTFIALMSANLLVG